MLKAIMMAHNNDEKRWSVSEEKDGMTNTTEVRQVENGFIVRKSKHGHKDDEYISENKEWISKTNPLDDSEKKEEEETDTMDGIKSLMNSLSGDNITI